MRNKFYLILDQSLFSGTNFIVNILIGNFFGRASFATYSIFFSIVIFFSTIQNAVIIENLLINKSSYLTDKFYRLQNHLFLLAITISTLFFSSLIRDEPDYILSSLFCLILHFWFFRRYFLKNNLKKSILSGISYLVYFLCTILIGAVLNNYLLLPLLFGIPLLLYSIVSLVRDFEYLKSTKFITHCRNSFAYGKFAVLAGFAGWLPSNFMYFSNLLDDVATIRAYLILVMPTWQITSAFAIYLLSVPVNNSNKIVLQNILMNFAVLVINFLFIIIAYPYLKEIFGFDILFDPYIFLILFIALLFVIGSSIINSILRVNKKIKDVTKYYLIIGSVNVILNIIFFQHSAFASIVIMLLSYFFLFLLLFRKYVTSVYYRIN